MNTNEKMIIVAVVLTVVASLSMIHINPVLLTHMESDFTQDEVFTPHENRFDFGMFSMNVSNCSSFWAEIPSPGHTLLMGGETYAVNVMQYDRMLNFQRKDAQNILDGEVKKPYEIIDGVKVHKADFMPYQRYGSFVRNGNLELYITSGDPKETAHMVNTLEFSS